MLNGSNKYNNAIVNLTHFYNYLIRAYLVRLYNSCDDNILLLKYLQTTESCLNPTYSNSGENDILLNCHLTLALSLQERELQTFQPFNLSAFQLN